jgi:curved DNA-binding protein CbpA
MNASTDYYELLQISQNAEPETIHRVYRLLAQRFHPDNLTTGNAERFRELHEAYRVLSDPEQRARYDVAYHHERQDRWRPVSTPENADNDFDLEQVTRLTVLEVLYTRRRAEPDKPGVFVLDLEGLTGRPREHLEFTTWYLSQKRFISRGDNSQLVITAEGVDYLEQNYQVNLQRRRLKEAVIN